MISLRLLVIKFIYSVLYLFYFMSNDSNFNQFIFTINQRLATITWDQPPSIRSGTSNYIQAKSKQS